MTAWWERLLFGPVAAVRPILARRVTLALLAFDLWLARLPEASKFGAGPFHRPHFAFLDVWLTPATYVAALVATGLLSLVIALVPFAPTWMSLVLLALYSWTWAASLLDGYQHHYLLSLVLLALAFVPRRDALDFPAEGAPRAALTTAWAWTALCAGVAIVYAWTAIAKLEPDWLSGAAIDRIALQSPRLLGALPSAAVAHGVVVAELVLFVAYLLAPFRDVTQRRASRAFFLVALLLALGFHLGVYALGLVVGWFGAYMTALAFAAFAPSDALVWGARGARVVGALASRAAAPGWRAAALAGLGAPTVAGHLVDLPGAREAGLCLSVVGVVALAAVWERRWVLAPYGAALALASLALVVALEAAPVRFDFYRGLGGDLQARGEYALALEAYVKANRYAPAGQDRRAQERALRALLEAQPALSPP